MLVVVLMSRQHNMRGFNHHNMLPLINRHCIQTPPQHPPNTDNTNTRGALLPPWLLTLCLERSAGAATDCDSERIGQRQRSHFCVWSGFWSQREEEFLEVWLHRHLLIINLPPPIWQVWLCSPLQLQIKPSLRLRGGREKPKSFREEESWWLSLSSFHLCVCLCGDYPLSSNHCGNQRGRVWGHWGEIECMQRNRYVQHFGFGLWAVWYIFTSLLERLWKWMLKKSRSSQPRAKSPMMKIKRHVCALRLCLQPTDPLSPRQSDSV